jgi:hypothetical protein
MNILFTLWIHHTVLLFFHKYNVTVILSRYNTHLTALNFSRFYYSFIPSYFKNLLITIVSSRIASTSHREWAIYKTYNRGFWKSNFEFNLILSYCQFYLQELSNVVPGRHVNEIRKSQENKSYIDFLVCMLSNKDKFYTFRCEDWEQLKKLIDALEALFGIPFIQWHVAACEYITVNFSPTLFS